jgi:putative ABC transport system permease protein
LTIGIAATIMLFLYAEDELSYDRFHEKSDRIYRINSIFTYEKQEIIPICIGLRDSTLQKQVPEIEQVVQIKEANKINETEFIHDNGRFKNIGLIYSSPNIHKVFTIRYLRGNQENALQNAGSLVLTRSLAERIFGTTDIIGKTIEIKYSEKPFTVSGVIEDYPSNSHLRIEAIIPLESISYIYNEGCELNTYVLFHRNINLKEGIRKTVQSYDKLLFQHFLPVLEKAGIKKTGSYLQPLTDIHLKSGFDSKNGIDNEYKKVFIYLSLALVLLLIAIINFINLLTAQYEGKLREIGIQKAIGASRRQIFLSFLAKSLIYSFVSLIIAAYIVDLLVPDLGRILNRDLTATYHSSITLFLILPLLAFIVGLISGIYPAIYISRFSPDNLIKKNLPVTRRSLFTRILVVVQLSIMIFLMISLLVIKKQILFMKNADLGINAEGVITITELNDIRNSYPSILNELKSIPEIKSIGASHHLFGDILSGQRIQILGEQKKDYPVKEYRVLPGFFETLGFMFIQGRPLDETINTDQNAVILNETAAKSFGLTDPMNSLIVMRQDTLHVIGVVKDFHFSSLENNIEPIMFSYDDNIGNISLKVSANQIHSVLEKVEKIIKAYDPDYVLDYIVLKDFCRNRYVEQEQMETLSTYTVIFSLLLAMLGLYALTAIMVQKRTKEIALRKINGATRIEVMKLLISEYLTEIIVSYIITYPIVWYVMNSWLKQYAYKTELSWWIFILTGLIGLITALGTISFQSWKAATSNPADSLRSE